VAEFPVIPKELDPNDEYCMIPKLEHQEMEQKNGEPPFFCCRSSDSFSETRRAWKKNPKSATHTCEVIKQIQDVATKRRVQRFCRDIELGNNWICKIIPGKGMVHEVFK